MHPAPRVAHISRPRAREFADPPAPDLIEAIRVDQHHRLVNKHLNHLLAFALLACPRTAATSNPYAILGVDLALWAAAVHHNHTGAPPVSCHTLAGRFLCSKYDRHRPSDWT